MMEARKIFIGILSLGLFLASCKKNNQEFDFIVEDAPEVLPTRAEVLDNYHNVYLASQLTTNSWTGNAAMCIPGTISSEAKDKALMRINYFRKLVRLNSNITWNTSMDNKLQQTALMMQANNTATHYPPSSWSCYTNLGAIGAAEANLSYYSGSHYPTSDAIDGQIEDPGASNYAAGHRRWLLYSKTSKMGVGATNATVVIGVLNSGWGNTEVPNFIAYPAKGYFPKPLVYEKWSFGKPNADFSNATVTMVGPNGQVPLKIISKNNLGIGDNTIVWEPAGLQLSDHIDQVYTVTVSGIQNAYKESYTYDVIIINP